MEDDLLQCKVVIIGESGVGKTCIISRFINDTFNPGQVPTLSASFVEKNIEFKEYDGKAIKFLIWDTAGQERFRSIGKIFYNDAKAIIMVYDITNEKSFEEIKNYWYNQILEHSPKDIDKYFLL
jgi:small GTP-binding protein